MQGRLGSGERRACRLVGLIVNEHMQTSDPPVYAAGDIAKHDGVIHGLWPVAVAQAEVAAAKRGIIVASPANHTPRSGKRRR